MRTKQCLTSSDVKKVLAAGEAEAAKNKWAVSISIADDGEFLLGFLRMDGATAVEAAKRTAE
jgi:glc operon protein GlcG